MKLRDRVYDYKTKDEHGFSPEELEAIYNEFKDSNPNRERFDDALMGITCMVNDDGLVIYHCDVLSALRCALESRDLNIYEWD